MICYFHAFECWCRGCQDHASVNVVAFVFKSLSPAPPFTPYASIEVPKDNMIDMCRSNPDDLVVAYLAVNVA